MAGFGRIPFYSGDDELSRRPPPEIVAIAPADRNPRPGRRPLPLPSPQAPPHLLARRLSVAPLDEWKLKLALLRSPFLSTLSDDDLLFRRAPDPHKLCRGDPVTFGTLYVRDLAFLRRSSEADDDEEDEEAIRKRFLEWRSSVVERLGGIELTLEGLRFRMEVEIPPSDDFERMKRSWEHFYASQLLDGWSSVRPVPQRPDTIIVQGLPSRWFAEP